MSGARAAFERKCNSYLGVLYDGTNKLWETNMRVICNGPNGMSGAQAAFEWKLDGSECYWEWESWHQATPLMFAQANINQC